MARRNYNFEKRQKDLARKKKQEEKRQRKLERKKSQPDGDSNDSDQPASSDETT